VAFGSRRDAKIHADDVWSKTGLSSFAGTPLTAADRIRNHMRRNQQSMIVNVVDRRALEGDVPDIVRKLIIALHVDTTGYEVGVEKELYGRFSTAEKSR